MTDEELKDFFKSYDLLISDFKFLAKGIMKDQTPISKVDIIALSIINRTIAIVEGFRTLINNNNTYSALHLIRIQIDNLIRYFSILIAEDDNYIDYILNGNQINKFKDKNGKIFSDRYLVDKIEKSYQGVNPLYLKYCGHIHFGIEHIERIKMSSDNLEALYTVVVGDLENYSNEEKNEYIIDFTAVSLKILEIIGDWLKTKEKYVY
ncbi:hypothetical protein [Pedobacter alluvionis]|uniref:Uncharacterized protein n=1 Tax=Pedobacter alluvionis TaxID=475253 RepID=A0A497YBB6_9SPHI|nr:hypothetical protein [Pedobacter alluvionis]RLJ79978.1 hypothetical protein BCL90_0707 [Pedobacter alluvionis]TFB31280.1 hypothetical protein E3V97_11775 [Pedobacter alluvionis]